MKVTIISDTHNQHKKLELEGGDILIHCGDFSHKPESVFAFVKWFSKQKYTFKILVAGNHDLYVETVGYDEMFKYCASKGVIYLEDTSVDIMGFTFYGAPWSNEYGSWAFMGNEFELFDKWDMIPDNIDILITHGPAYNTGDEVYLHDNYMDSHVGSKTLQNRIKNLPNLKYHFFGHIHESYGSYEREDYLAVNASSYNHYKPELNKPINFEI